MKITLSFAFALLNCFCYAQLTTIPDDNFELYLETHNTNGFSVPVGDPESMGNGIVGDNLVLTNKINIAVDLGPGPNITDLTGINEFTSLEYLYLYNNQITNLSISIPSLGVLGISNNNMETLDISGCNNLWALVSNNNNIENLDLTSNIQLEEVYLNNNSLYGDFDLSNNTHLLYLELKNNNLETIDIRNRDWTLFEFDATQNSFLNCVFVDDTNNIPSSWLIDNTSSFVEDETQCNNLSVDEFSLFETFIYPNPSSGNFKISTKQHIKKIEIYDVSGKIINSFNESQTVYQTNELNNGIYFIKIVSNKNSILKRLIIQK